MRGNHHALTENDCHLVERSVTHPGDHPPYLPQDNAQRLGMRLSRHSHEPLRIPAQPETMIDAHPLLFRSGTDHAEKRHQPTPTGWIGLLSTGNGLDIIRRMQDATASFPCSYRFISIRARHDIPYAFHRNNAGDISMDSSRFTLSSGNTVYAAVSGFKWHENRPQQEPQTLKLKIARKMGCKGGWQWVAGKQRAQTQCHYAKCDFEQNAELNDALKVLKTKHDSIRRIASVAVGLAADAVHPSGFRTALCPA